MTTNTGNYKDVPPDTYDGSDEEWLELSYSGQYYHYNPDRQKEYKEDYKQEIQDWMRELKKSLSCPNCGESHHATIVFHHVDEKNYSISVMVSNSHAIDSIKDELSKCVAVCANCHRKHHTGDLNLEQFERVF